jgi:hypothetical protein
VRVGSLLKRETPVNNSFHPARFCQFTVRVWGQLSDRHDHSALQPNQAASASAMTRTILKVWMNHQTMLNKSPGKLSPLWISGS